MSDWMPSSKAGQLALARQWQGLLATKATDWNIPAADVTALGTLITAAAATLEKVQDKTTRTQVDVVACDEAFSTLVAKMRFLKRNYFNSPPRTAEELTELGLPIPDRNPTPAPPPLNVVAIETRPLANGLIELLLNIVGDIVKDAKSSDYGYKVYVGVEDANASGLGKFGRYLSAAPVSGLELGYSFFTKKKKNVVECDEQDRMKKIWFAVRLENAKGQAGPWGPLVWTAIP